jgi:hypothetical protein
MAMSDELSRKEKLFKDRWEKGIASGDLSIEGRFRRMFGLLPSDPRCSVCYAPFKGLGSTIVKVLFNKQQSDLSPLICDSCERAFKKYHLGTEF